MRGQLSVEFLLVVAISFAILIALAGALSNEIASVKSKTGEMERISLAESAARAVEIAVRDGIMILPDGEKITTEVTKKQREILDALHMCA